MNRPTSTFDMMPSFTVKYMSIPEQSLCSLFSCTRREESPIPMYVSDRGDKLTVSAAEAIYYEANDYDKYSYFLPIDDEINDMSNYFVHEAELDFCSSEDALAQIDSVLSSVGISTANSRIIAMDQSSLNDAQKQEVCNMIDTLLSQQLNDQQSLDSHSAATENQDSIA